MANTKSSKKRIKTNKRNRIQNNSYKSLMRTSKKNHLSIIEEAQAAGSTTSSEQFPIEQSFALAISKIDKAVKKNIIHKNTAARKKSNLYKKTFGSLKY